jgi:hypothetical protein
MNKDKIFISHAQKDSKYIKLFVEKILRLGLDIAPERIFCSSMEGHGVKSGEYIPDILKQEISRSILALLFISKNYKGSEVCLNEVGAAWVTLTKETVIPLLMSDIDFSEIGFLDINRLSLRIDNREGILKLIEDCKEYLNPNFKIDVLNCKIEEFLFEIESLNKLTESNTQALVNNEDFDDWTDCFINNLNPLDEIIRKVIPAYDDGIHNIKDTNVQNKILFELSQSSFLRDFWYRHADGDIHIEQMTKLTSGNWLISTFNLEIKISDMWVCLSPEFQYEFVLIKTDKLEPFQIQSDIGGLSYNVGILKDGTIVNQNERLNGFATINGDTINIYEHGVESRIRKEKSNWVFLVSSYHKAGYNPDETIEFCEKLDNGIIEVNEDNILMFLRSLKNHPVVIKYR